MDVWRLDESVVLECYFSDIEVFEGIIGGPKKLNEYFVAYDAAGRLSKCCGCRCR